jgi:hypothetical protein
MTAAERMRHRKKTRPPKRDELSFALAEFIKRPQADIKSAQRKAYLQWSSQVNAKDRSTWHVFHNACHH